MVRKLGTGARGWWKCKTWFGIEIWKGQRQRRRRCDTMADVMANDRCSAIVGRWKQRWRGGGAMMTVTVSNGYGGPGAGGVEEWTLSPFFERDRQPCMGNGCEKTRVTWSSLPLSMGALLYAYSMVFRCLSFENKQMWNFLWVLCVRACASTAYPISECVRNDRQCVCVCVYINTYTCECV